jgi:hypothetical protein
LYDQIEIPSNVFNILNYSDAIYYVKKNNYRYHKLREQFYPQFILDCVKVGIHFSEVPKELITLQVLDQLIAARASIINELPSKYVHDGLYIICMRNHGMKISEIPEEFQTSRVATAWLDLHPEEIVLSENQQDSKQNSKQDKNDDKVGIDKELISAEEIF